MNHFYKTILLLFIYVNTSFSQERENIKIVLKDFHSSKITDLVLTEDESHFISSDLTGKILLYSTEGYSYAKTLRGTTGIPIQNMRLIRNDSILLFNQKYEFSDGKTDSVIGMRIHDNKIVFKKKLTVNFIGKQENAIITNSKIDYSNYIEFFDTNFNRITSFNASYNVKVASIANNKSKVAFVEDNFVQQLSLIIKDVNTGTELAKIPVPEKMHIAHLFFEEGTNELFSLNIDKDKKIISVYNISKNQEFSNPEFSIPFILGKFVNITTSNSNDGYFITISSNSSIPYYPIIISKHGNKFSSFTPKYKDGVSRSVYLKSKKEFIFSEPYNTNFSSIAKFNVFDFANKKKKESYPKNARKFYSGTFLPNNNWMVIGNELNNGLLSIYENHIKYYTAGTFENRYGKLNFSDYLEVTHKIKEFSSSKLNFDKRTGVHPFYGYKIVGEYENQYGFYKYDFIKDKVTKITEEQSNYRVIVDYNDTQNYLLLSSQLYTNDGHTESQQLRFINRNKTIDLKGSYKFGKFSNSGEYLLTINSKNLLQARSTITNKIIYEEQLIDGSYKIFNLDENGFILSNSFRTIDVNKCNKESIMIAFDDNKKSNYQKNECVFISDLDQVNDKIVMITEGIGTFVNNKPILFPLSEFPQSISLNSDGSKVMISLSNGMISVYDTETLNELGTMIHPDKNSHIFIGKDNNYFSNIKPKEYLCAYRENQKIPFNEVENIFFNPERILSIFSKPNLEYVKALKKALKIRAQSKGNDYENNDTEIKPIKKIPSVEIGQPNLYVLSIGVSNYKQSDYNLTFADKDALDIAKIYGKLNQETLDSYKTKFLGETYSLYNEQGEVLSSLNKYSELYATIGKLYAVSTDSSIWLEHKKGEFFIWNYNTNTIRTIIVPSDFKISSYSFDKKIFINPDNTGFYLKTDENKLYSYNFNSEEFTIVELSFETESKNYAPLTKNRWLRFSYGYGKDASTTEIELSVLENNSEKNIKTLKFNLNIYNQVNENSALEKMKTGYFYNPELKAVSSDGNIVLYAADGFLFHINLLDKNPIPLKLPLSFKVSLDHQITLSQNGESFCIVESIIDKYRFRSTIYDLNCDILSTFTLKDEEYKIKGFSAFKAKPKWIKASKPLVSEGLFNDNELLANSIPHSFSKSFVKYLTNANANSKIIKEELNNFFKNAKSNDQVVVFLAGHGVLDKELNYYFAPHDMDFNKITTTGIPFNSIIESLKKSNAINKLLLMDSCHSGNTLDVIKGSETSVVEKKEANQRGSKAKSTSPKSKFKVSNIVTTLFEDFLSTSGVTIISASSGADVAYENKELGNGAFTSAYINLLKKEIKGINYSIDETDLKKSISLTKEQISEIFKEVMILTNGKQVPDLREINESSDIKLW